MSRRLWAILAVTLAAFVALGLWSARQSPEPSSPFAGLVRERAPVEAALERLNRVAARRVSDPRRVHLGVVPLAQDGTVDLTHPGNALLAVYVHEEGRLELRVWDGQLQERTLEAKALEPTPFRLHCGWEGLVSAAQQAGLPDGSVYEVYAAWVSGWKGRPGWRVEVRTLPGNDAVVFLDAVTCAPRE